MYEITYIFLRSASIKLTGIPINVFSIVSALFIVSLIDIAFRLFVYRPEVLVDASPWAMQIPNVFSVPFVVSILAIFIFSRRTPKSEAEQD